MSNTATSKPDLNEVLEQVSKFLYDDETPGAAALSARLDEALAAQKPSCHHCDNLGWVWEHGFDEKWRAPCPLWCAAAYEWPNTQAESRNEDAKSASAIGEVIARVVHRSQSAPLTDDEIDALFLSKLAGKDFSNIAVAFRAMVRAVEAAHGIGGDRG
jgi:hypothetical protein